jgi:transposase-like protein
MQLLSLISKNQTLTFGLKLLRPESSINLTMLASLIVVAMTSQTPMPDAACLDLAGNMVVPLARTSPPPKGTVLIFHIMQCPISRKYTPEINRIYQEYSKKGIRFYMIHEDLEMTPADVAKEAKEFGLLPPILIDKWRSQLRRSGATMSPEAAVYDAQMRLTYLGRIDNRWITLGNSRPKPTVLDLRNAIDGVLLGKSGQVVKQPAIGCVLPKPN